MKLHYSASVEWSEDDDEFVALSPEFPGASGSGESPDAAIAQLQESITVLLAAYAAKGVAAPEPRLMEEFSGQVRLRMPKALHRQLAAEADRQGVSLNTLFIDYLAQGIGGKREQDAILAQLRGIVASHNEWPLSGLTSKR